MEPLPPETHKIVKKITTISCGRRIHPFYITDATISSEVNAMAAMLALSATGTPNSSIFMQSLHGSFSAPFFMHLTPVSGSTKHSLFALRHTLEVGSLSQGPSSHILSILVLSSSLHSPAAAFFSKSASVPGQLNELSVWHMAVSSKARGSPAARST